MSSKPSVFIGSSKAGLNIARAIQYQLKDDARVSIWNEGLFGLTYGTLETLVNSLERFDFAILVLTPDDLLLRAGAPAQVARDNVMFELGLFMGHLGRARTFVVSSPEVKLPSDLAGVTVAPCEQLASSGSDQISALGPACLLIREALLDLGAVDRDEALAVTGRIEIPEGGTAVDHEQLVRGTARLAGSFRLYLAVKPINLARFYPQVLEGPFGTQGERWTSRAFIGLAEERQRPFELWLLAADAAARKIFDFYRYYGNTTGRWLGFEVEDLPPGCKILHTIEVVRR